MKKWTIIMTNGDIHTVTAKSQNEACNVAVRNLHILMNEIKEVIELY